MKIAPDDRFRSERARFSLRFTCEHCAAWDEERDACAHGYPTAEHRAVRYERDRAATIVFCKEFDAA